MENTITNIRFGLLNYLQTGNAIVDMMLASSVPFIIAYVNKKSWEYFSFVVNLIRLLTMKKYVTTEIVCNMNRFGEAVNTQGIGTREIATQYFVRALMHYLAQCDNIGEDTRTELASVVLSPTLRNESVSDRLSRLSFCNLPVNNTWVKIDDIEIWFEQETITKVSADGNSTENGYKNTFKFRARTRAQLDGFMQRIFNKYIESVRAAEDKDARYLFTIDADDSVPSKSKDIGGVSHTSQTRTSEIRARRYKMSLRKSFDTIFFPKKNELISIVESFLNKSGIYAINGYAHKLGIMLHGEPGTGKTSVIKALANYTKRHIVMVSLNQIKDNSQLIDLMFNPTFRIMNEDTLAPMKLTQSDCIFVFEDIDACCDVVKTRDGECSSEPSDTDASTGSSQFEILRAVLESTEMKTVVPTDGLTLAGILNVLDGPLEADDRIVIFTSNHPQTLDPALIRPGRIDHKFYLTYAGVSEVCQMIELYFGSCDSRTVDDVEAIFKAYLPQLTPANLEVIAVKSKDQHKFVRNMERYISEINK